MARELTYDWQKLFLLLLRYYTDYFWLQRQQISNKEVFFYNFFEWLSLTLQFAALSQWPWQFLNAEILQARVATPLSYDEMFNSDFIAKLLVNLPENKLLYRRVVKEYFVNAWPVLTMLPLSMHMHGGAAHVVTAAAIGRCLLADGLDPWQYSRMQLLNPECSSFVSGVQTWKILGDWLDRRTDRLWQVTDIVKAFN